MEDIWYQTVLCRTVGTTNLSSTSESIQNEFPYQTHEVMA